MRTPRVPSSSSRATVTSASIGGVPSSRSMATQAVSPRRRDHRGERRGVGEGEAALEVIAALREWRAGLISQLDHSPFPHGGSPAAPCVTIRAMATYVVNPAAIAHAERMIGARQYVLVSDWGRVQPRAAEENAFLALHGWEQYAQWHLALTEGARDGTKARYAFVYGDFRRVHRMGLIACHYRAAEWRHKEVELAAHELLQRLDAVSGSS